MAGAITVLTGLVAKKYGPVLGGLFLAFPAIFPASVTLIEKHEREKKKKAGIAKTISGRQTAAQSAISWYVDGFTKRSGIQTRLEIPRALGRLPRDAELALFRILQESSTNVHRHSGSRTAIVRLLLRDARLILEVTDQGKGIPTANLEESGEDWTGALGVGLRGMHERMR